mmetsp:Transcript_17096/g.49548  ORF Transcript_17096/g.49548 Transcript_17096/m.49548 type:complete len:219 (+) Transcript_17096:698-1354(+)
MELSRMVCTQSPSQETQSLDSSASKSVTPSCSARSGTYSMMARRTRHCLSSASCTTAGSRLCASRSTPITELTACNLEITLRRTSGYSSRSRWSTRGRSWLMVCALPRMGARPITTDAMAARTCWEESRQRSATQGITCSSTRRRRGPSGAPAAALGPPSAPETPVSRSQTPVTLKAAAVLTSCSLSRSRRTKAGTRSCCVTEGPSASQSSTICSATT